MRREVVSTGHSVEDAIEAACVQLGKNREEIEFEIIELPTKRILGILGASSAKVRVYVDETVEERAITFLKDILAKMGLAGVIVESYEKNEGIVLDLAGEGMGAIIGHRGETLDALQYLVSLVANKGEQDYCRITLDTGDYREKREKTLTALAKRIAVNAVRTRRNQTLEHMNPYERRIIHSAVQEVYGATSWSVGEDPNRRVVIGAGESGEKKRAVERKQ
ncbi:MAG: RNA-binding cell elongation regulator Jag/EloR [Clostridia bacterium]|nr:RNA-binding cell elongation regulator Jag/EloR [Clostridia bacterium]